MHVSNQKYARKYEKSYPQVSFLNCMHVGTIEISTYCMHVGNYTQYIPTCGQNVNKVCK